jgi:cytochrome b561
MTQSASNLPSHGEYHAAERYNRVAIALHWLIAALLSAQIAFGWFLESVPRGTPARGFYVNLHKSTGLTLAVLILVRIAWRLMNPPPPLPSFIRWWERAAARWSHVALYVCMLGMPLSGYLAANFSKYGVKFFNVVMLPPWGVESPQIYAVFNTTHVVLSYLFVTLIAIHVMAALRHAVHGDGVIARMLLARKPSAAALEPKARADSRCP